LRRHALVESVRGPGGGYTIARDLDRVTVADIISAVDEPLDATQCGGKENCLDEGRCMTHDLWSTLNEKMHEYLSSVTLADLVVKHRTRDVQKVQVLLQDKRAGVAPDNEKQSDAPARPMPLSV
jgi:Rrf2 family iron-sulfur cluster assembly transcriptional regulator